MGPPIFEAKQIPVNSDIPIWNHEIEEDGRKMNIFALSMGNPHVVTFIDSQRELSWVDSIGPKLELLPVFPNRTNVGFALVSR